MYLPAGITSAKEAKMTILSTGINSLMHSVQKWSHTLKINLAANGT